MSTDHTRTAEGREREWCQVFEMATGYHPAGLADARKNAPRLDAQRNHRPAKGWIRVSVPEPQCSPATLRLERDAEMDVWVPRGVWPWNRANEQYPTTEDE